MIGIYYIANKNNGKMYIGKSKNIEARIKRHFAKNNKPNSLYRDIEILGNNCFAWGVIEECCVDKLDDLEVFYINSYESHIYGYNIINTKYAMQCEYSRVKIKKWSNTIEQKKERSARMRRKWCDEEWKNNNLKHLTSASKKHHYLLNNNDEYKKFFSERCSSNRPNRKSITMLDKETQCPIIKFEKLEDAAIYIRKNCDYPKADYSTIRKAAKNKNRSAYGYKWLM